MRAFGTVKDAATEKPLPGAKIVLYIREKQLAILYSNSEGKFEHKEAAQYIGEILFCKAEKEGYEPREVMKEFEQDELPLEIKLDPVEEEKIALRLSLKDEKKSPLKGVKITLEVDGEQADVGFSDKYGLFKVTLSPDLEDKTINYKAELGGFELASGEAQLKKETSHEITLKRPPPPPDGKWLKIAVRAAKIAAVISAGIIIWQIIPFEGPPEMPVINYLEASPSEIRAGEGSTLSWSVSDATSVTIYPEIGSVGLTGTRVVYLDESTTYTLTATNEAGRRDATVEVIVEEEEINLPVINFFTVSEISVLSWSVSGATSVTIEPGIGDVALTGTSQVSPTKTTTYTLTATNDAGSVKDTVIVEVLPTPPVITWDFETGDLSGWTKTGTAFDYQPTYGDNPTERRRGQPSKHQGDYWIGSYEKYPGPDSGYLPGTVQGDKPQGTLTSSPFTINTNNNEISFLIGGGNHPWPTDPTCVNLEINGKMVKTATGKNTETMERVTWDVSSKYNGQEAVIKLYDMNSESWGHINFDDVKFEEFKLY